MEVTYVLELLTEAWQDAMSEMGTVGSAIMNASNWVSLLTYIATAYSLFTIAGRRGLKGTWMAWIPLLQLWTLGQIADDYRLKAMGQKKNRRTALIVLRVAFGVLLIAMVVALVFFIVMALESVYGPEELLEGTILTVTLAFFGSLLLFLGTAVALAILRYMALYDLYRSCEPENAVLYLVLNIFFTITQPVFLLVCHKKDKGMPQPTPPVPPLELE